MRKGKLPAIGMVLIIVGVIVGLGISSSFNLFNKGFTQDTKISQDAVDLLAKINEATAEVAAVSKPAVVNISSTKTVHIPGFRSPFFDDPFFRDFFGNRSRLFEEPKEYRQSGVGSGVIVDASGYILTNNHVITNAEEIKVKLSDKQIFKGKVVGTDPKTDLAVVKIDAGNLPVLKLGDSDKLKVGDRVIAIGNPFGLNQTVTAGIISAKGRADVGISEYEDFIQTDAPINPGNSGGALVNIKGELVGINTAIASSSGGYQGIGFAIPSNMAKVIMESLIKKGKIIRGWLGVSIQPITTEMVKQLGLKDEKGALVAEVMDNSPAEKLGLQAGDVITEFDGKLIGEPSELKNVVANTPPGKEVTIKYLRDGSLRTGKVVIEELPERVQHAYTKIKNQFRGVSVQDLTADIRSSLDIPKKVTGVVVTDVAEDSDASEVLAKGDIIMQINKKKIKNSSDYEAVVSEVKTGQKVLMLIYRNGSTIYMTL